MTFTVGRLGAGGANIRYTDAGTGSLVVILDGGGPGAAPLQDALARNCRVARLELSGFADAPRHAAPRSMQDLANLATIAIGNLSTERYTLIGESFTASVALWHTLLTPDNVDALALVSPIAILPAGDPTAADTANLLARPENAGRLPAGEPPANWLALMRRLSGGVHDAELESLLGEIPCATLAVFGLKDRMVAPEAARVYREKIPNCNVSLVYDAGHAIIADRPEALTGAVSDFVERRETFIVGRESGLINP